MNDIRQKKETKSNRIITTSSLIGISGKLFIMFLMLSLNSCVFNDKKEDGMKKVTAAAILANPDYKAISYGGYRKDTRSVQPTITQLKEDLKILAAIGVKVIRTYNVHMPHAVNTIEAIEELKIEDENFEMYVMLGAWIDCKNAWTGLEPIHEEESERNAIEIERAAQLAVEHPDIVKIISVGNEAMVKWATEYYVYPKVILKWVNHLQGLKEQSKLPKDLWITSSDNFASWGGGEAQYKVEELNELIHAVDYISMHTYSMHDTHYNPIFWGTLYDEQNLSDQEKIDAAMVRSVEYSKSQYYAVKNYMHALGADKPIHVGETGWASYSEDFYGDQGSLACDEYKQSKYHELMREWTRIEQIKCFYFEAFDEPWKDADNPGGSENHFGLFDVHGQVKYVLWDSFDKGVFQGLSRDGVALVKTYNGNKDSLWKDVQLPPVKEILIPEYQAL